jgi:nitrate/nitrite transport system substrate-binding protein
MQLTCCMALVYGVHLGIGGPKKDMAVLMSLNNNGQAITLSNQLKDKGVTDGPSLAKLLTAKKEREYTFAQTFPTGTHAMWLYYWLAAHGIDPFKDVKVISWYRHRKWWPICASATWTDSASASRGTTAPSSTRIGFTAATTQDIWTDHPEKGARHHLLTGLPKIRTRRGP